ncbi:MAG: SMC-Scp complex subunit ScpB [Gammaproteobacteria bacterium]|nr:SMC-Scp complex subunit ScpB [Gammaproteobacteria bacterium]
MELQNIKNVVEAALLAAGRPLQVEHIRELFDEYERPEADLVSEALAQIAAECETRPVELREVASGWRLQVRADYAGPVSRLWQERPAKYSRALLETLALIAYRQPITRAEIEDVRGVAVNPNIIKTITERGWIRSVGHREVPGRPELLGTTREFLDYFGLKSLDELPTLAALKDMDNLGVQLEFPETAAKLPGMPVSEEMAGQIEQTLAAVDAEARGDEDFIPDSAVETGELTAEALFSVEVVQEVLIVEEYPEPAPAANDEDGTSRAD